MKIKAVAKWTVFWTGSTVAVAYMVAVDVAAFKHFFL